MLAIIWLRREWAAAWSIATCCSPLSGRPAAGNLSPSPPLARATAQTLPTHWHRTGSDGVPSRFALTTHWQCIDGQPGRFCPPRSAAVPAAETRPTFALPALTTLLAGHHVPSACLLAPQNIASIAP